MKLSKIISAILISTLSFGLFTACGFGGETSSSKDKNSGSGVQNGADDGSMREELTSLQVAELMGNGINLGNTMEAYGRAALGTGAEPTKYETYWGQPVTNQEMIDGMKAAGFDTIRIPVAWTNMMAFETGDYTIDEAYLARVKEIVDYARTANMYVIINDHWDGGWWGMFGSANEDTRNQARELYTSMWTQIAGYFKDYSDYLIFEGANEELGFRLNDTDIATDSGSLSDADCFVTVNEINQLFVDTVRATGGNNEQRFLLIPGFGTEVTNTCKPEFVMPQDAKNSVPRLLISVHYYDPSGYCIFTSQAKWGSKQDYEDMNKMLRKMQRFTTSDIGVVIGEYGVLMEDGILKDNAKDYYDNFLNNCDMYGYVPLLWDCNNLYSRTQCKIIVDELAQMYKDRSRAAYEANGVTPENLATDCKQKIDDAAANAKEAAGAAADEAIAWIMYTSGDWGVQYSVGDTYAPESATAGIVATDVQITGEGTYTVSLDMTETSAGGGDGMTFSALGISNGETLFSGMIITLDEVKINGEVYELQGTPYTTSDDKLCTRVNLYNGWVSQVPAEARTLTPADDLSPTVVNPEDLGKIESIEITFTITM